MKPKITFLHLSFKELAMGNLKDLAIALATNRRDVNALSRRNSTSQEAIKRLLEYSDNKLYLLLDNYYKKIILKSETIRYILKDVKTDIEISPNGYISTNNTNICKINTWKLLRDLERAIEQIGDINYLESKNILTNKDIYEPFIIELEKIAIVFDVDLFYKNKSFLNCKTEYYNKIILLQEKMKNFFVEYDFLLLYGMNWSFGVENNLLIKENQKFSIVDNEDLIVNESNIDLLLNTPPIQILLNLNKCKKINSFIVFKELIKNISYIRNMIEGKAKEQGIEELSLDLKIGLDREESISISFDCLYKKDLYLEFECSPDDLINLDYEKLLYKYYLSDSELNKLYSFEDFNEDPVEAFKNMTIMNY